MSFHKDILQIDCRAETEKICAFIQKQVTSMKRKGAVIGISGGVDSALCSSLCVMALGEANVVGLILPEKESDPVSSKYAAMHAKKIGLSTITDDITPTLEGFGTYERRDKVIREIFPEYNEKYVSKLTLPPDLLTRDAFNFYTLTIKDSETRVKTTRLNIKDMRRILAATNTKQITRMMFLNYYAEMNNYIVCGTTNRSEFIQGFFVKYGDGGVDIEPIAHLYKMQVYQIAAHLGIIKEIMDRPPSPDTFSFAVSDEEMHFRMPYNILDLLLFAWEHRVPSSQVSAALDLSEEQVARAFRDFDSKYRATEYQRLPPQTIENH